MQRREFLKALPPIVLAPLVPASAIAKPSTPPRYVYAGGNVPLRKSARPLLESHLYETKHGLVMVRIWGPGHLSRMMPTRPDSWDGIEILGPDRCSFAVRDDGLYRSGSPWESGTPIFLRRHYAPGQDPSFEAPSIDIFEVALVARGPAARALKGSR